MTTTTSVYSHDYPEAVYYDTYSEDEDEDASRSVPRRRFINPDHSAMTESAAARSPRSTTSGRPNGFNVEDSSSLRATGTGTGHGPSSSMTDPPQLEASWINAEPFDEFVREVSNFIMGVSKGRTNIEVEAKIGVLIDTRTNQRLNLPLISESILSPDLPGLRFETDMSVEQHAHYNRLLNGRTETTSSPAYPYSRIGYAHTKVVDSFHASSGSASKLRVTSDEKTGAVKECIIKERLGNLNVYCPQRKVDWRISVNTEVPVARPTTPALHTRRKDRLTYTHQAFRIDLTQVQASQDPSRLQHELEVEFQDTEELMRLATLREVHAEGGWAFDELVRVFVNNVRILVRNAI